MYKIIFTTLQISYCIVTVPQVDSLLLYSIRFLFPPVRHQRGFKYSLSSITWQLRVCEQALLRLPGAEKGRLEGELALICLNICVPEWDTKC